MVIFESEFGKTTLFSAKITFYSLLLATKKVLVRNCGCSPLLRVSGIPSRYVRGDVEFKIEDLMNWSGGKTPEAAIAIMQRNKIPVSIIYKFDAIEGVIFDHIWVEAFDGHNWRLMDPSFKTYVYTEGVGFGVGEDVTNIITGALTVDGNKVMIDYSVISDMLAE